MPDDRPQDPSGWGQADDIDWGEPVTEEPFVAPETVADPEPAAEPEQQFEPAQAAAGEPAAAAAGDDPGQPDPAALIVAWLRRGFDGLHVELQRATMAIEQQQTDLIQLAESQSALARVAEAQALLSEAVQSQSSEINVSLAELEGCAAQLRNEAASLHNLRSELSVGFGAMLLELREALIRELSDIVAKVVQPAIGAAVVDISSRIDDFSRRSSDVADPVVALREMSDELNDRLPLIVREAVRAALPVPPPAPFFESPPAQRSPELELESEPESEPEHEGPPLRVAAPEAPARPAPVPVIETPEEAATALAAVEPLAQPVAGAAAPAQTVAGRAGSDDEVLAGTDVTCVMPGVSVGPSLAVAVTAALERSRIRRRRRRRAGPPSSGLHRRDPFAGDVGRRLERFALARGDRVFEPRTAQALPELRVAAGEYGGHEFAIDLGVLGCLCLVGPQAAGVARALAMSLLAQPSRAGSEVIAVGDVLPSGPPAPGLARAENIRSALDRLEAEVADRAKRLADAGAETVAAYNGRHPDEPITPLLVVTAVPADADGQRLRTLVSEGGRCAIAAVVVDGELDSSPTLQLKTGGVVEALHPETTLGGLVGARLFLLGPDATAEVLEVLSAASTDDGDVPAVDDEPFVVVDPPGEVPVQVQLMGAYRIDAAGNEIRSGLRAKARELLAFYLLHPEGATLDTATEALWPEADPGRGSEWFWTALGNLRSLLRSTTGIKELKVIEREGDVYKVEPIFDVDLWRLQQVLDETSTTGARAGNDAGNDELWAECLQRAADLYSGELLEGADWAWAKAPRDDLRRRAVDVLVALGATRLVTGDVVGALDVLQRAIDVDPYSEQLYRRVIRLHGKLSRPDAVSATFARLQTRLAEIDLEPTAESVEVHKEFSAPGA